MPPWATTTVPGAKGRAPSGAAQASVGATSMELAKPKRAQSTPALVFLPRAGRFVGWRRAADVRPGLPAAGGHGSSTASFFSLWFCRPLECAGFAGLQWLHWGVAHPAGYFCPGGSRQRRAASSPDMTKVMGDVAPWPFPERSHVRTCQRVAPFRPSGKGRIMGEALASSL